MQISRENEKIKTPILHIEKKKNPIKKNLILHIQGKKHERKMK
jgi:hypothetical protein